MSRMRSSLAGDRAGTRERISDADDDWKEWVDKALESHYSR
jgi:hypothetical protein